MVRLQATSAREPFVALDASGDPGALSVDSLATQAGTLMGMFPDPDAALHARPFLASLVPRFERHEPGTWSSHGQSGHGMYQMHDDSHDAVTLLRKRVRHLEQELQRRTQDYERRLSEQKARLDAMSAAQQRLADLAGLDDLTGLPNRRAFAGRLRQALKRAKRAGITLAVLFIDLDNFKFLNDCYGHGTGDQVLRHVAGRLSQCIRGGDSVCRWGGDEFVLVAEDAGGLEGRILADRIMTALGEPLVIGATSIKISASCGLSVFPDDGLNAGALLHHADIAMYQLKRSGQGSRPKA